MKIHAQRCEAPKVLAGEIGEFHRTAATVAHSCDAALRELKFKDGALNLALQEEVGLALPVQREIAREIAQAVAEGLGDEDLCGMERYFGRRK
jgi:hypothetical protein